MENRPEERNESKKPDKQLPNHITRPEIMKNYKAFKNFIIHFKHEREGTLDVDYREAADLAWELAEHLPEGIILDDSELNSGGMPPPGPDNWAEAILAGIICLAFIAMMIFVLF